MIAHVRSRERKARHDLANDLRFLRRVIHEDKTSPSILIVIFLPRLYRGSRKLGVDTLGSHAAPKLYKSLEKSIYDGYFVENEHATLVELTRSFQSFTHDSNGSVELSPWSRLRRSSSSSTSSTSSPPVYRSMQADKSRNVINSPSLIPRSP